MENGRIMKTHNDEGIALVLALLLMMALSVVGASLMFLAQTETYSSLNYRLMSQARYGAESGVHKAANYLLNSYATPGTVADPLANYNFTVSPVTYNGAPVVLSGLTGVASNYPVAAVRTAFSTAVQGTLQAGNAVQYGAYATLLSMRQVEAYGTGVTSVVQTWQITADGTITGARTAVVEVAAVMERQVVPTLTFGVFATNNQCGAINWGGASTSDSYDSTNMTMVSGHPASDLWGGNVGTNGNLTATGNATVYGSLSTPRTGVGHCTAGAVSGLTENGQAQVTGGMNQLPQALTYPTPALPNPLPPVGTVSLAGSASCADTGLPAAKCTSTPGVVTLIPGATSISLGDVNLTGGSILHLTAGTYNLNSITLAGNSSLVIDSGPVIMNVVGAGQTNPIDFTGGVVSNSSFDPTKFQILYAGTNNVKLEGGTATSAMVFVPNASVSISGGSDFYGAILGKAVTDTGGTHFHYDRSLQNNFMTLGNYMLSSFTWKKS